ncbi:MAG: hypothetical protein WC616_01540 [Candidatus Omnitrophota bacterium]
MSSNEILIERYPHRFQYLPGGEIVFFCLNGKANFLALPETGADFETLTAFYEAAGRVEAVRQIELSFFKEVVGLCELEGWQGDLSHKKCQECKKKGGNESVKTRND